MQFEVTIEDVWKGDVYFPDFVYNRFVLFDRNNCKMVQCEDAGKNVTYRVLVHYINREYAEMGLWLNPVPEDAILSIIKRIFHEYNGLKVIQYKNAYHSQETHKLEIISGFIYRKP